MDAAEFSRVGAELVELGERLKGLKDQRDDLNKEIAEIEARLRPLVVRHAQMIADLVGATAAPQPAPMTAPHTAPATPGVMSQPPQAYGEVPEHMAPRVEEPSLVKAKIIRFLQNAPEGISALDIAEKLRLDPVVVRQTMHELMTGSR